MEKNWERTLPFFHVDRGTICKLFEGILEEEQIISVTLVDEGCRTSNYIVTDKDNKKYILKIFFESEQEYRKEYMILDMLKTSIPVQKIYKFDTSVLIENKYYAIYKFIEGKTLSQTLNCGEIISEEIIREAAGILADIHKTRFESVGFFDETLHVEHKLKPLNQWYDEFMTDMVENRLGEENAQKIKFIIQDNMDDLLHMDRNPRLVHGDFQGTNILIDKNKISGIIDWEFAMAGHPLSDIGQFFRYEEYFDEKSILVFEEEYRKKSDYVLPDNWYKLSRIRDLENLIQLMGFKEEMPNKYKEIKNIIIKLISEC
ncbi:aminoglycoside phosphotransferase family protein [uncultured Clostridium sp.]|uniref:aminoglycoside phosphotransferase family protein n=1 Tax=uncultured Clostridium sp. TaxID=59620 RepID=UPI0025D3A0FD|nr:aminoglycoside phosphotransferase family protein [uncultured Clostridium sp.]